MIVCKGKTTGTYAIADWHNAFGGGMGFWSVWREPSVGPQIGHLTNRQFNDCYERVTEFIQLCGPSVPELDPEPAPPPPTRRWQDVTAAELAASFEAGAGLASGPRYTANQIRSTATQLAEQDPT